MTPSLHALTKRIGTAGLAFGLALVPVLARADASGLDLRAGSGAGASARSPELGPAIGDTSFSGLVALDIPPSGFSVGPRLTGEAMYGFAELAPQLRLDLGGRFSFAYHSADMVLGYGGSMWLMDFVPDAKLRYSVTDLLGVYGDFGLGLAFMHFSSDAPSTPLFSNSSSDLALAIQFGLGAAYALSPNLNLLGELRFDFYTKDGASTFIAIPTVGIEFH